MKIENIYYKTAVKAVSLATNAVTPNEAWQKAVSINTNSNSSQKKGCPKNTFLGLCEEGLIRGIARGKYTNSKLNKSIALNAINILKNNLGSSLSKEELWKKLNTGKNHNSQMDVVLALWNSDLIVK